MIPGRAVEQTIGRGRPLAGERQAVSQRPARYPLAMDIALTAVFKRVPEGYIGYVEELPGANTQGGTLEETRANGGHSSIRATKSCLLARTYGPCPSRCSGLRKAESAQDDCLPASPCPRLCPPAPAWRPPATRRPAPTTAGRPSSSAESDRAPRRRILPDRRMEFLRRTTRPFSSHCAREPQRLG